MFTPALLSGLNELELSIYDCVVKNRGRISHMTIKDLAEEAHVSTGSVQRFCKRVGCDGYSHFKLKYREYLQQEEMRLGDAWDAVIKNFLFYIDSAEFQQSIDNAFALIQNSKQVIFIGIGSSGTLGRYGARYFSNIGRFSFYVEDPWQPVLQNMTANTIVIALSESGTTQQTIDIANQLRERGCLLIAITNNLGSTLAKIADCNIVYHVLEVIVNKANITTQVPVIYILETLAKRLYVQGLNEAQ